MAEKFPRPLRDARTLIVETFESQPRRTFTATSLVGFIDAHREAWRIKAYVSTTVLMEFLLTETPLRKLRLESQHYASLDRFSWGDPASPYELALTLRQGSYLSHGTAVSLLGLTDEVPTFFYVNKEQSPKPARSSLTQEGINRAFAVPQRKSRNVFRFRDWRFVLLNGKHTGNLGVEQRSGTAGETLRATGLERTLIDIAVRPTYAGGVFKVQEAYRTAKARVEIGALAAMLRELDYVYPYHQAIGFYLERSGIPAEQLEPLRRLGISYEFFLAHGLSNTTLDSSWRLRIPAGI
jgi:predicted transcriptional regulator of viral defense system